MEAELEEEAYRFRRARLEDRGFPEYYEAQNVFAYLDPRKFDELRAGHVKPSREGLLHDEEMIPPDMALAMPSATNSLFNAALTAGFAAEGKRQLRSEMAMVTNQVLVARSVDYGDLDAVHVAVEMTHNYLNLALEHLASGDLNVAVENLRDTHLQLLFRLGVSLTIDLRTRAQAAVTRLGLDPKKTREIPYLDSPYREAIAGFMLRQPRFYEALDGGGSIAMRDFRSMRDLHIGYAMVDQIDRRRSCSARCSIDIASPCFRSQMAAHEIRLSQIVLTGLGRLALDNRLAIDPIEGSRLTAMRAAIMSGQPGRLTEEFHRKIDSALAERLDEAARKRTAEYLNSCVNALEDEFANLGGEREIDPRFIESVLVRDG